MCLQWASLKSVSQAKSKVSRAKNVVRDLGNLKGVAAMITRTLGETKDLKSDISRLERDLESTGTLKTVEDVQHEVDLISNDM